MVSIITPLFNKADYVQATLESVMQQTYRDYVHYVIDDASTDRSVEIVSAFAAQSAQIRLISCPENRGAAAARNVGLQYAAGQFIAILDADDYWEPSFLETMITALRALPESVAGAFCLVRGISHSGDVIFTGKSHGGLHYLASLLEIPFPVKSGSSAVLRRNAVVAAGGWPAEVRAFENHFVWARLGSLWCVPVVLVTYRIHPDTKQRLQDASCALKEFLTEFGKHMTGEQRSSGESLAQNIKQQLED